MSWPIYLLIVFWGIFGIMALIWPKKMKTWPRTFMTILPYWVWGLVILVLGYFIWQVQSFFIYPLVIQIIAVLAGIKGLSLLVIPKHKWEKLLVFWTNFPDIFYRIFGILLLVLAFLIYKGLL